MMELSLQREDALISWLQEDFFQEANFIICLASNQNCGIIKLAVSQELQEEENILIHSVYICPFAVLFVRVCNRKLE